MKFQIEVRYRSDWPIANAGPRYPERFVIATLWPVCFGQQRIPYCSTPNATLDE
jgi:hypothetical protein